jgi:hypothetical protein
MQLSKQAKKELRETLCKQIGPSNLSKFSDEMLDDFGLQLLEVTKILLKSKSRNLLIKSNSP